MNSHIPLPLDGQPLDHPNALFKEDDPWFIEDARITREAERESAKIDRDLAQADADQVLADYLMLRDDAERGDPQAQLDFGITLLAEGDLAGAFAWFRRSAEQGFAMAQVALSWCYSEGEGVEKDPVQAAKWHQLAARQEDKGTEEDLCRLSA